ncbi:MAG: hypothetical protein A4E48_00294 [Methanosaeta sp. PtaU1.Bin060]|nr:MAG: hypothetical protein A4E48_00294 [Methanosaeta sp. PtaU1.Bin060]
MSDFLTPEDIRKYAYASGFLAIICFLAIAYMVAIGGSGNNIDSSLIGTGTMDYRHDSEHSSDRAMANNATIIYEYSRSWGRGLSTETMASNFIVSSGQGGWKTQYAVKGTGAGHKVDYRATKISGDASFASEISLTAVEGSENFDSVIQFDTRDGNATIQGRVYNSTAGRPATIEELDAVGKYILNTHLNVSLKPITPEDWLEFCGMLDQDVNMPDGIYILPVNDSLYNYTLVDGRVVRLAKHPSLNGDGFPWRTRDGYIIINSDLPN